MAPGIACKCPGSPRTVAAVLRDNGGFPRQGIASSPTIWLYSTMTGNRGIGVTVHAPSMGRHCEGAKATVESGYIPNTPLHPIAVSPYFSKRVLSLSGRGLFPAITNQSLSVRMVTKMCFSLPSVVSAKGGIHGMVKVLSRVMAPRFRGDDAAVAMLGSGGAGLGWRAVNGSPLI